jgi:hypothetical protein
MHAHISSRFHAARISSGFNAAHISGKNAARQARATATCRSHCPLMNSPPPWSAPGRRRRAGFVRDAAASSHPGYASCSWNRLWLPTFIGEFNSARPQRGARHFRVAGADAALRRQPLSPRSSQRLRRGRTRRRDIRKTARRGLWGRTFARSWGGTVYVRRNIMLARFASVSAVRG